MFTTSIQVSRYHGPKIKVLTSLYAQDRATWLPLNHQNYQLVCTCAITITISSLKVKPQGWSSSQRRKPANAKGHVVVNQCQVLVSVTYHCFFFEVLQPFSQSGL